MAQIFGTSTALTEMSTLRKPFRNPRKAEKKSYKTTA
jgi:hypothetical protein